MAGDLRSAQGEWAPPEEFDDYVIERPLGAGRMGRVYLAQDAVLARPVAIKFIASLEPDISARQKFLFEARAAARIQHPNVIAIYRVGELDQLPYIITEFVRGKTLDQLELPLPADRVFTIGLALARGLAAAHRCGVVHGDIKPGNAILSDDGTTKLLDFGLAAFIEERIGDALSAGRSPHHGVAGTPDYMAPEVWRAEPADPRSDVYALGAVLYELVTGKPPFAGVALSDLPRTVQDRDPPPLVGAPGVDQRLAAIVDRCLRRDPAERYASADELVGALEQLERAAGKAPPPPGGNPYRGLRRFEADHRALFFGRSQEIGAVVDRLRAEPFVLVTGGSGTGKSSLCRAGVLPAVADGALGGGRTWQAVLLSPGRAPMRQLAEALAEALGIDEIAAAQATSDRTALRETMARSLGSDRGVVLFVDQLEELVTLSDPGLRAEADRALARLVAGGAGLRVLATARTDYLGRLAGLAGLGEHLQRALYFLRPIEPDRMREIVVGPARAAGVEFESDAMVDELCAGAGEEGSLPLLQFALASLWEARDVDRGIIPARSLDAMGGVAGALSRHADEVIRELPAVQAAAARRLLGKLVSAEGRRTRRGEDDLVGGDPAARAALDALVRGRLLVAVEADGGSAYELAHDVLLTGWTTLRGWLLDDADERVSRERIQHAASEWERLERSPDTLWGAGQLAEVARVGADRLAERERRFLAESRRAVRRRTWRRRALVAALPVAVAALYLGIRVQNRMQIDARVAARSAEAKAELDSARAAAGEATRERQRAYALFETRRVAEAESVWDHALQVGGEASSRYAAAARLYEVALAQDPTRDDVHERLGGVLYERALIAERDGSAGAAAELIDRVTLHDPHHTWRKAWQTPMRLRVTTRPAGARLELLAYRDRQGRLELEPARELGAEAGAGLALAPGSYLLRAAAPGRSPVAYPLVAERGADRDVVIDLPPASAVPPGTVYIPAGRFRFGSAADEEVRKGFLTAAPIHTRETGAYLIQKTEVTFGEWIAYLDQLGPEERARRTPRTDRGVQDRGGLTRGADGLWTLRYRPAGHEMTARAGQRVHYDGRRLRGDQDWLRFPVTGVTVDDVKAYAGWLDRTGRLPGARLCSEEEWERAARGADDRIFPAGRRLDPEDANFDQTYGKDPAAMGPDEVGSHPASTSPFGLVDMSGNAFEWTTSVLADGGFVGRGGSYFYDTKTAQVVNRAELDPTLRDASLGFRLCATYARSAVK